MEIPRHWRLKKQRYGLIGSIDPDGHKDFPPTPVGKFGNEDQARSMAVHNASIIAEKNLVIYVAEMKMAQVEQGVDA